MPTNGLTLGQMQLHKSLILCLSKICNTVARTKRVLHEKVRQLVIQQGAAHNDTPLGHLEAAVLA